MNSEHLAFHAPAVLTLPLVEEPSAGYAALLVEIKSQIRRRKFFNEYSDKPKLQPQVREISWAKSVITLAHCKEDQPCSCP